MATLQTPTSQQVADGIVSNVELAIAQTIPLLPKEFTRVLAKALGGQLVLVYKYAGFMFLQLFVERASFEPTEVNGRVIRPLVEWGRLVGVGDPVPATRWDGTIDVTVTNQTGSLPANSQLVRSSTGIIYTTTASVLLDAATVQVPVRVSLDGAGTAGNLLVGDELTFANPLPNISPDATVAAVTTAGTDAETESQYRGRVIRRFQARPQGGAYADYRVWAEEVPGIIRAYPYTAAQPGEVDVYVEASVASSGSEDGIPTAGQLDQVAASIEFDVSGLASRRPVGAAVNVLPITRTPFDVTVVGLDVPDVPEAQASIEAALDEFLRDREPFIVGLSVLPRRDKITAADIAGIVGASVAAVGGSVSSVQLEQGGGEVLSHDLGEGEKAKLGTVDYI